LVIAIKHLLFHSIHPRPPASPLHATIAVRLHRFVPAPPPPPRPAPPLPRRSDQLAAPHTTPSHRTQPGPDIHCGAGRPANHGEATTRRRVVPDGAGGGVVDGGRNAAAAPRGGRAVAGLLQGQLPGPGVDRAVRGDEEEERDGGHHPGDAPPRLPRLHGRGE